MVHVSEVLASCGCRWVQSTANAPSQDLKETLYNAAYHDGAHGLHASAGMVIVTAGSTRARALPLSVCACADAGLLMPCAQQRQFMHHTEMSSHEHFMQP